MIFLIHGYNGPPQIFHWLKKQLEKEGYKVILPEFPKQIEISYASWSAILDEYKSDFMNNPIVIAHSVGNAFIVEYCARNNLALSLYIGLAGFGDIFEIEGRDDLNKIVADMKPSPAALAKFSTLAAQRYAIYSDNDHLVPQSVLANYPKLIKATAVMIPGIGHMGHKSGLTEIPEVLEILRQQSIKSK